MIEQMTTQDRLLSAEAVGKMLSLSRRQIFRLNSSGKIPAPIRIGRAVRWAESTIAQWLKAGAPDRKTFEAMQQKRATAPTTAQNHNRHKRRYLNPVSASMAKLQIGELLLFLQRPLHQSQEARYWAMFESMLRQYLDSKHSGEVL